jgi:uncharacterized protein (TIGR00661 family)
MTQAMAAKEMLEAAGHTIAGVVVGLGHARQLPEFFTSAMRMPAIVLPTLEFVFKGNRAVNLPATVGSILRRLPDYARGLKRLDHLLGELRPDVILNFFEPLTGLYALTHRQRPPVVAVGHQFMLEHPRYVRAPGLRMQQWGMKWFTRLAGAASTRVALSFYSAPDLPSKHLFVCPPLLRRRLFDLRPEPDSRFVLVYLLNHGYAEQIVAWSKAHPNVPLHCFYDRPGVPAEFRFSESLTFHRLDGEKFLRMMAACRAVVCTAGFESVSEAAYLGKPLFMVPVENHVEQQLNALDARSCGFGVPGTWENLDPVLNLPARNHNAGFRKWLHEAQSVLFSAINMATTRDGSPNLETPHRMVDNSRVPCVPNP